jgi:hypothetical protein
LDQHDGLYVHLKDQRGSGTEPVNVPSRYKYQDGLAYYESTRDTATISLLITCRKPVNPIWSKIQSGQPISDAEKNEFAAYMIHLSRRVPAGRDLTDSMWPGIAEDYEPPDELYRLKGWPKTPEARLLLKAEVKAITQKPGHAIQMHRGTVLTVTESLMVEALKMTTVSLKVEFTRRKMRQNLYWMDIC